MLFMQTFCDLLHTPRYTPHPRGERCTMEGYKFVVMYRSQHHISPVLRLLRLRRRLDMLSNDNPANEDKRF